jgi:hypothetical protein
VEVPLTLVFMAEGFHVPLIPFVELKGNEGAAAFSHNDAIGENAGTVGAVIVISSVVFVAHCPASGVNVYVDVPLELVLIIAGLHVPLIPLVEFNGNEEGIEFWHKEGITANVGIVGAVIVISSVVVVAHCPASGVNV